jgi:glycosyltransferase involved in cell wall biosynthesis
MVLFKTSLICTVFNEERTVQRLIDSIAEQTKIPDETIFVDGGSNDRTREIIRQNINKYPLLRIKLFIKKGNRSVGRNEAIKRSKNKIILSTDAGGFLEKRWVENITKPFLNKNIDVVAGYYKGIHSNIFQKSLIPYVLVMKDKLEPKSFLPATRSMAFKKQVWGELGGFDEKLSHNEDFVFANKIKDKGFSVKFQPSAITYWIPRSNLVEAFKMFLRFAYGDAESGLLRDKVAFIFLRYFFALYLAILSVIMQSFILWFIIGTLLFSYIVWSIYKNYKYVGELRAFLHLPLLQFTSDVAVLIGSILGQMKSINLKRIIQSIINNKGLIALLLTYILLMIAMIDWGVPNRSHPFNYFMDEWHQSQSVRNLYVVGSPNIEGSANGSVFHFFLSGLFLVPFYLFGIIDPFAINSSVSNLTEQQGLFEVLRLNTLFFGVLSIIVFYNISKKYFKLNPLIPTFFFIFNPVWIMLSNYFKYDIALMFWTLLSFAFMLRYISNPNFLILLFATISSSIALSVKLQPFALPLLLVLIFIFFTPKFMKKLRWIITSILIYLLVFVFLGIPDILLGKGDLYEYLSSNLIRTPSFTGSNIMIEKNVWEFLIINIYPTLFGFSLYLIGGIYGVYLLLKHTMLLIKNKTLNDTSKEVVFILLAFVLFSLTLIPLGLEATNNRALILLPFLAIFSGLLWQKIYSLGFNRKLITTLLLLALLFQSVQTAAWIKVKLTENPRRTSSEWILSNLPKGSTIGIEGIPIYQFLPDIVLKEYYEKLYNRAKNQNFDYYVINNSLQETDYIILTNSDLENKYLKKSNKKELVNLLNNNEYREINNFTSDFSLLKYFSSDLEYYVAGIVQSPIEIEIYEKGN